MEGTERQHKIKVALFVGYKGTAFHGLQKNNNVETIESALENALFHAGFISSANYGIV